MENSLDQYIKLFDDVILFDYIKGHFVKKCDVSEEIKKKHQEHAEAHLKMITERYKDFFKNK